MQVELRRQSRFPSFGVSAISWFTFYCGPAPSAPPREPDEHDELVTGGSSGSREGIRIKSRVIKGTTPDRTEYNFW